MDLIAVEKVQSVNKGNSSKKISGPNGHNSEFYKQFKKAITSNLQKLSKNEK